MVNNLQQMYLKLVQKIIKKTAEAAGDLIVNKVTDKITKVSKNFPKNNSNQL